MAVTGRFKQQFSIGPRLEPFSAMPPSTNERISELERELEKAHDRIDGVNTFAEDIARLSVQTSQRQGIEVAKTSLVFFGKGGLKGKLMG